MTAFKFPSGKEITIAPIVRGEMKPVERTGIKRVAQYSAAVVAWMRAGKPQRSQTEIDRILAICEACPMFSKTGLRQKCKLCGCSVNSRPNGLTNKIAMATEHCPAKPAKW